MRRALWAACAVAAVFACTAPRKDELECEEAVAHLEQCCPGFDARPIQCVYDSGCNGPTYPDIAIADAECIRDARCDFLVSRGVCDRAANPHAPRTTLDSSGVCP